MTPKETPSTMQMNLQLLNREPMILPQNKQRELAIALADMLLNTATAEPTDSDKGVPRPGILLDSSLGTFVEKMF